MRNTQEEAGCGKQVKWMLQTMQYGNCVELSFSSWQHQFALDPITANGITILSDRCQSLQ